MTDQLELLLELVTQEDGEETRSWDLGNGAWNLAAWLDRANWYEEREGAGEREPEEDSPGGGDLQIAGPERMSAAEAGTGTDWGERQGGRMGDLLPWDGGVSGRALRRDFLAGNGSAAGMNPGDGPEGQEGPRAVAYTGEDAVQPGRRGQFRLEMAGTTETGTRVEDGSIQFRRRELPQLEMAGVAETGSVWNAVGLYQSVVKTERAVRTARARQSVTIDRQMTAGAPSLPVDELDRAVRRDSRRYDGAMELY